METFGQNKIKKLAKVVIAWRYISGILPVFESYD